MASYIFLGPELGKKQDAVDNIKKKMPGAEEHVFYAGETNAAEIADTLQNNSLFSESRIIIIKNADQLKKDEADLIASCIKESAASVLAASVPAVSGQDDNTALILLSDEIKLPASLENAVPQKNRQVFYELFEREKNEWIRQFFAREGLKIDKDCIAAILEMVENNTEALKRECSRLVSFLPREQPVKPEDIEKWLSHTREESVFTLFSRIAAGDLSRALEAAAAMLAAKEKAPGILAGLAWCFRKLGDYIALLEKGEPSFIDLKKLGLSVPKVKDDYAAAAGRYNADDVEYCLALTAEYDILLRSPAAAMENILMDRYLVALMKINS
ncbi:MAG: DNA polymerase III subunit delta [Treponema sp.]|jgi:DNA polymerase-3 subunit delta|nr:DNA polymerase III subunit delta [Treponema sp.]